MFHGNKNKYQEIKSKNVLVAGVTRNCANHIKAGFSRIQSSLQSFNQVSWLIVESDSDDNTLNVLNELSSEFNFFHFISLGNLSEKYPLRTDRIAFCRNVYLKEIREDPLYRDIDFVVIADFDGINTLINEKAILSCFDREDWDVCTANQEGPYYDIWALRHKDWCPGDCWEQAKFLKQYGLSDSEAKYIAVHSKMLNIPQDRDWIEVDSAFGGLAIYHKETLDKSKYIGVLDDGKEICEHVTLHQQLREQGFNIFLNPALVNAGYNDHNDHYLTVLNDLIKLKFKGMLKRFINRMKYKTE